MTSANLYDISNTNVESNWDQIVDNFDDMDLKPELLRGIYAYGLKHPSAIQQRAIVPVIQGRDCIVQAQPSTGKTVALSVAVLQTIDTSTKNTQALILAPTRELAQNIREVIVALGHHMGIECHACVGGTNVREEKAKLQEGVHVVVGTSGRVHDMINRHALRVDNIKLFCLDETDEMLSRGFVDQVHDVFKQLPQATQVVLCSDTLPEDVLDTIEKSVRALKDPVQILVKSAFTLEGIKQFYINVKKKKKSDTLCDMYNILTKRQTIILCNSRRTVESLAEKMRSRNLMVSAMHGQTEQKQREGLIQDFHSGSSRFLISTDLHMRGFDVQEVPLVVNYDLPTNSKDYIYRISRKGHGVVINFVTIEDTPMLRDIEKLYSTQIAEAPADIADVI